MLRTFLAWLIFLGGFAIEIGVDRFLRMRDGDVGGIPEPLWFAIPILLAAVSVFLAWQGTRPLHPVWKRLAVVSAQVALGFIIYTVGCVSYVLDARIASL